MRISPPVWLPVPEIRWLPAQIVAESPPQGFVVVVNIEGQERAVVVPAAAVKSDGALPGPGFLRVLVIAELPDENKMLAELPSTPMDGSQRLKVTQDALEVA